MTSLRVGVISFPDSLSFSPLPWTTREAEERDPGNEVEVGVENSSRFIFVSS